MVRCGADAAAAAAADVCAHSSNLLISSPLTVIPPLQLNCCSRTPETMLLKCESADFQHKNAKANYFATNKESMTAAGGEGWREGDEVG